MENKSKELSVAIEAALAAGKVLEKYFETGILREFKEDNTPVTLADTESEEVIKRIIIEAFPDHSILGEETGHTKNASNYTWHIDPLDGTSNFANGLPLFAISIALEHKNELLIGVIYNPATRSLFYCEKGKGAYMNDKKIFVSKDGARHGTFTTSPGKKETDRKLKSELFFNLSWDVVRSSRDLGCAALDLAYVAMGTLEAVFGIGQNTYDFAAGMLLVQEAGGKVTLFDGSPWKFPENYFIASNGVFHERLVEEVMKQKEKLGIE